MFPCHGEQPETERIGFAGKQAWVGISGLSHFHCAILRWLISRLVLISSAIMIVLNSEKFSGGLVFMKTKDLILIHIFVQYI